MIEQLVTKPDWFGETLSIASLLRRGRQQIVLSSRNTGGFYEAYRALPIAKYESRHRLPVLLLFRRKEGIIEYSNVLNAVIFSSAAAGLWTKEELLACIDHELTHWKQAPKMQRLQNMVLHRTEPEHLDIRAILRQMELDADFQSVVDFGDKPLVSALRKLSAYNRAHGYAEETPSWSQKLMLEKDDLHPLTERRIGLIERYARRHRGYQLEIVPNASSYPSR